MSRIGPGIRRPATRDYPFCKGRAAACEKPRLSSRGTFAAWLGPVETVMEFTNAVKLGSMATELNVVELRADDQIDAAFDLMAVLRPSLRRNEFVAQVRAQERESGFRLAGGFDAGGRLVVLAGYKRVTTLSQGAHLFVDDLVTAPDVQGRGYGRAMLAYLAGRARVMGVRAVGLQSRPTARGFYEKVGFTMSKGIPCSIEVEKL